jgi:hypothetical protein
VYRWQTIPTIKKFFTTSNHPIYFFALTNKNTP